MVKKVMVIYYYFRTKWLRNYLTNREKLDVWQKKRIENLYKNILPNSLFYREWLKCPKQINKRIMMDNFSILNTMGIKKEDALRTAIIAEQDRDFSPTIHGLTVGLSSGTSGSKGIFLVSEDESASWAGTILAKMLPRSIFIKTKIAFFLRANSNLYESVRSSTLEFKFFDLKLDMTQHCEDLAVFMPDILVAPPYILKIIADSHCKIFPKKIISVADVLHDIDKKKLEKRFKQRIHQIYQATEGLIACTCKEGNLHINEDLLKIEKEYIDIKNGRFIPIITDFSRTTQPIVKYRLNDILIEDSSPCPCGSCFMRIKKIEGREDEILLFKNNTGGNASIFPDFVVRSIIAVSEIEDFRVVKKKQKVELHIVQGSRSEEIEKAKISLSRLLKANGVSTPVFVKMVNGLTLDQKRRRVVNED